MLNVRQNSIIDPLKATAGANAVIIDSVWLPKIKSTNGKSAEFTLSGGENNVAFRVYGFEMLTAPKLYEKVGGEWKLVDVSSLNNPDKEGNAHAYDGYTVHYDGDGTYSYAFITTLVGNETKTFKVVADEEFKGWPEQNLPIVEPTDVYFNYKELITPATASNIGYEIDQKEGFIRLFGDGASAEKWLNLDVAAEKANGKYAVIKYRVGKNNDTDLGHFQIYTGTKSETILGAGDWLCSFDIKKDGDWHVMAIDVSAFNLPEFEAGSGIKYFRFDIFNALMSKTSYVDVAYVAICKTLDEIVSFNKDVLTVELVENENTSKKVYTASGTTEATDADLLNLYIDAEALKKAGAPASNRLEKLSENGVDFVRYWGDGERGESFTTIYNGGTKVTGHYIVLKYRIPTTNKEDVSKSFVEFFTSTTESDPQGHGDKADFAPTLGQDLLIKDGEWHTIVIDLLSYSTIKTFTPDANGDYKAKFIRFDFFNGQVMPSDSYMDVAFVGMCVDPTPFLPEAK